MTCGYHVTTFPFAQSIQQYGFKRGEKGNLGPGIYFAFNPQHAYTKAQCKIKESMFVVLLNVGRLNTVYKIHPDWTLKTVKNHGYDSVQKLNCKSGPEICIYEPHRITIVGIVIWDTSNVKFMNINNYKINESEFSFLTIGKKVETVTISKFDSITRINSCNNKMEGKKICSFLFHRRILGNNEEAREIIKRQRKQKRYGFFHDNNFCCIKEKKKFFCIKN